MATKKKTAVDKAQAQLEKALTERYETTSNIQRKGERIIIPERMGIMEAAEALEKFYDSQEEEAQTAAKFDAHPNDGLVCFYRAMKETYGELLGATVDMGFFGKIPGRSMDIPIDYGQSITVPVGDVEVPGLPIEMDIRPEFSDEYDKGGRLVIIFSYKRKYSPLVDDIIALTRKKLKEDSIFSGKAFNDDFEYIEVESFDETRVVYSTITDKIIRANILAPIQDAQRWKSNGNSLKRGILLYGPYGTGKTLTALAIAKLCKKNKWTFINVRPGGDIKRSLNVARSYSPAVVFFEDIDQQTNGERTGNVNEILNTVDGLLGKSDEVMVILTTNHIEKITRAMLRPGRLDAVIKLGELDGPAAVKLFDITARNKRGESMLDGGFDPRLVEESVKGLPPAFLVEAVVKAKAYAMLRLDGDTKEVKVNWEDVNAALSELRPQVELMEGKQEMEKTTIDTLIKQHVDSLPLTPEFVEAVAKGVTLWRENS